MNSSYSILAAIIGLFLLFLYSSWIYISAKYVWKKEEISSEPKKKIRWKNIVDKKNEELGWFDLGNHIIILGEILFAIFIVKNT